MPIYACPFCNLTSNRKYNLNTHIIRKHPGSEISPNLLSSSYQNINSKNGRYPCPFCNLTSNRKYNLNTHIIRKHPGSEISPKNLNQFAPLSSTFFNSKTSNSNNLLLYQNQLLIIGGRIKNFIRL